VATISKAISTKDKLLELFIWYSLTVNAQLGDSTLEGGGGKGISFKIGDVIYHTPQYSQVLEPNRIT
jgi:hypothetical protein